MVVRIQKHKLNYVADPLLEIKKQDWIIIRLMYIILAIDPSMMKIDEIKRTKRYLQGRYDAFMEGTNEDLLNRAFWELMKDPIAKDTFKHVKDVRLIRDFDGTIQDGDKDDGTKHYFGTMGYILRPGNKND